MRARLLAMLVAAGCASRAGDPPGTPTPVLVPAPGAAEPEPEPEPEPEHTGAKRTYPSLGAEVTVGDPEITGALARDRVERFFRLATPQLRYCYERVLVNEPGIGGSMVVRLAVASDGRVASSIVEGVHGDIDVCVVAMLDKLRLLPASDGAADVVVAIDLTRPAGGATLDR